MPVNRVRQYVKKYDVHLEPVEFAESTSTVEEAAQVLGVEPAQIAKSILFRAKDQFGLFVTAGDVRVNLKKVKTLLGGKPKMATPEEVEEVTGFRVGGVCPFDLKQDLPIFLDESMKRFDIVYAAAGSPRSALPITFEQLQAVTGGTVVNVQAAE
ncbi:prolyl-tRNA synthetase [Desulforamulus profundi]|uniref:Prolyl-tRNA synthetase n=1 Tax=Desulforamulus profundi TaxID=1383067 RepID=A0A2C6MAQ4_9FIRM|nr:YbaK/EbsC family protein [Desulforamulus profundi]PHJ39447.1 prolyl-tRNA synthetase [Desulforamulus profundi]